MAKPENADVIVIGAGMAGLCCAGELVLQGARPLLISETKEVGVALRPTIVAGNRGLMQVPTYGTVGGGSWWGSLVRRLNVPVRMPLGLEPPHYHLALQGDPQIRAIRQCSLSAAELTSVLCEMLPPLADVRVEVERIFAAGLAIPFEQLVRMHDVPLMQWLEDEKADELAIYAMLGMCGALYASTAAFARDHASVFGAFGCLRAMFCGEASFGLIEPDHREGLAVPIAREIERRGATVLRGRKVAKVETGAGRIGAVVMADGTELRAGHVAIACGSERIATLVDPLPPEAEGPIAYGQRIAHRDFGVFAVLDQPVVPPENRSWVGVLSPEANMVGWFAPQHNFAPWLARPGQQLVHSGVVHPAGDVDRHGGEDAIYARLHDMTEFYYPGYQDAIVAVETITHKPGHLWYGATTVGPKLPRRPESVEGLWFVGENSVPLSGIWMESAASAGILGARAIAASVRG